jgi:hypothetical protein
MSKLALSAAAEAYVQNLKTIIADAKKSMRDAERALYDFESLPENNVYATVEDAGELEDILREQAAEDCEGSHNIGNDEYRREFLVDGVKYAAILSCEYDRHDKTYYYIYSSAFEIVKVDA